MTIYTNVKWPFGNVVEWDKIYHNALNKCMEVNGMTIEERIRAKKEEIKSANRDLSKLQDEARAKNEPMTIHVSHSSIGPATEKDPRGRVYGFDCKIVSNKKDLNNIDFLNKVQKAIESLSESSEPKSYVDWNKIPEGYNHVAIDSNGRANAFTKIPHIDMSMGFPDWRYDSVGDGKWIGVDLDTNTNDRLPLWDKSLIHRPGIKE